MKTLIILLIAVIFLGSCRKSYQCNITTVTNPEAPMQTKHFWNDKQMHQWEKDNSVNGKIAKCW